MDNELYALAEKLAGERGKGASLERVAKLFSTDAGKRVLATLLADGGDSVKRAADAVKSGDVSGIGEIISKVASTPDGEAILDELKSGL